MVNIFTYVSVVIYHISVDQAAANRSGNLMIRGMSPMNVTALLTISESMARKFGYVPLFGDRSTRRLKV